MLILGYAAAILIGISLGMIGSGGSILTVPVLVYLLHVPPLTATASSLFIVGCTSLVGAMKAYSRKQVEFRTVTEFGIPSIFSIFIARHYILPAIPARFTIGNDKVVSKELLLMIVFSLLMLIIAVSIIGGRSEERNKTVEESRHSILPLVLLGLLVGLVTGLLGAGGGFLIIPSLIFFLRLPMRTAVGTSLFIIAVNSLLGFLFSLHQFEYDWVILCGFTALAIVGIFIGSRLAEKVEGSLLRKGFGWFVLAVGVYILLQELFW